MARTRWFLAVLFVLAVLALLLFYFARPATGRTMALLVVPG